MKSDMIPGGTWDSLPQVDYCLGFSAPAAGSKNPMAEKRARFHPHAPKGVDEKCLDRPRKMQPPQRRRPVLTAQLWPFPWAASASRTSRPGCVRMKFLKPVGRMKLGNLRSLVAEKINFPEIG